MSELYLLHPEPRPAMVVVQVPEVPTAVVSVVDYPLDEMSTLFDRGFSALFPALAAAGITPVGPAFSLHHRIPTATGDFEIGVPVDRVLPEPIDVDGVRIEPSVLPGGDVATVSHVGAYDALGEAWGGLMASVIADGREPAFPFWEVYVTEPSPDADPATLRTDLYTRLA